QILPRYPFQGNGASSLPSKPQRAAKRGTPGLSYGRPLGAKKVAFAAKSCTTIQVVRRGRDAVGINLFFQTMERLTPQLRAGDLAECESAACDALRRVP